MPRVNVKDKRKQQLMEANIASIAKRGLEGTTIAHVSKGADMSRGIVNFYFVSKEKMMQETLTFLAEEYTAAWQDALAAKRKETDEPMALVEAIVNALMSDRMCSAKRMAVWSVFIGTAATHSSYTRIISAMDAALTKQLKELLQKVSADAKAAEDRTRQLQASMRGHWLASALGEDSKKPSFYSMACLGAMHDGTEVSSKVTKLKQPVPAKAKKPLPPSVLPGQLDFGDLFSRK